MPIIRLKLSPDTIYPSDIRYNPDTDTVQSNVNGTWVDNPSADPRNKSYFPPRVTSDPACDAAQSVVDAFKGQIDQILTAIDNASTGFTIAGIILSFLEFGVFAVLIDLALFLADQMITAGSSALNAALTGAVYDQFKCILFCQFDSNGRLKPGGLAQAESDTTDQIGGLAALVLNAFLQISGEGGVDALAALGSSTGDCSTCDCGCGDETIADTIDVYFGTVVERTGCTITIQSATDGDHQAIGTQWDGTHGYVLTHDQIVAGSPQTPDTWQRREIPDTGPIFSSSPPYGVAVQQLVFFDSPGGSGFTIKLTFRSP